VGDYDNDGFEDIYLYGYRCAALLHNEHGRRLVDVTRVMGLSPRQWGTAAAFADVDNDGRLDLYVGDYVQFGPDSLQYCPINHINTACGPKKYAAEHGTLYRNTGTRFVDVTHAWGADADAGKILGVAFADYDGSGHESLATANDEAPGSLLHNAGKRFTDEGVATGVAFDQNGYVHGGMGIDWGDYDNDGKLDLLVATYQQEVKSLYHNGGALFTDNAIPLGLAMKTSPYVAFGAKFIDADNDGWLDILFTNGHTEDNAAEVTPGASFRQPTLLFHNRQGTAFDNLPDALPGPAGQPIVGRGLAIGDFDNDGRMDALVVDSEGAPLLLHNETTGAGNWLLCRLVGTHCNRDGIGALLRFDAGGTKLLRRCGTDGSYMSASDRRVHVGLGAVAKADIEVRWPDGHIDRFRDVQANRIITLEEGAQGVK
jgi:hypothetical protein